MKLGPNLEHWELLQPLKAQHYCTCKEYSISIFESIHITNPVNHFEQCNIEIKLFSITVKRGILFPVQSLGNKQTYCR